MPLEKTRSSLLCFGLHTRLEWLPKRTTGNQRLATKTLRESREWTVGGSLCSSKTLRWRSETKIQTGRWSNRFKTWHVPPDVTSLVLLRDHARSHMVFMFMISRITSLENYLRKTNTCGHHPVKSFRSLEFLTPDTNDAPPATSLSPKIFWPSAALSERVPVRILTSDLLHRTLGFEVQFRFISATHGRPLSLPFFVTLIFTVDLMVGQNSQMYDYSCCCCCCCC